MKFRAIAIVSFFAANFGCGNPTFPGMSKKVDINYSTGGRNNTFIFHRIRMKLFETGRLDFVNKSDTLFVLDMRLMENGLVISKIWNTSGSIDYAYDGKDFKFNENRFSDSMILLVQRWDTLEIRRRESRCAGALDAGFIYASQIIKKNNEAKISSIHFKDVLCDEF